MDSQNRLNYIHTNVVIPNIILSNKNVFLEKIIKLPQNLSYFIKEDTYKTAASKLGLSTYNPITCNLTANKINDYFVAFVEFSKDYGLKDKSNMAVAIAVKEEKIRYFTYECGISITSKSPEYFVGEWSMEGSDATDHNNYGKTDGYGMPKFASKVKEILEREGV